MSPQFCILQSPDSESAFSLLKEVYSEPPFPLGGSWTLPLIEREIENHRAYGLKNQNELQALLLVHENGDIWDIVVLATAPKAQKQGLMTQLLQALIARKPQGLELWLEVHEGNRPAQNLYKKLGFRQVGRRAGYYRDGGAALLYSLR